jgi:predicted HAD superfamily Cof-like phosphohydrolase
LARDLPGLPERLRLTHVKLSMGRRTTIEEAAEEFVEVLRARAEAAAEIDDALAAETWHKAADAAARKLRDSPGPK